MAASQSSSERMLAVLKKLHPRAIDLSLDRLEILLGRLGHPETQLPPVVHVAGTNGKGSTVAFVRAGLESFGSRVHAYTSPHLVSFHERIRLASEIISEKALSAVLTDLLRHNAGDSITFFEATTAAALLAFSRTPADYTLLEVGMGGRLDATNVAGLSPRVCVITPISLDHTDFLGATVELIAAEKAGILRPNVPCVVARQSEAAMNAIRARAREVGAPLLVCGEHWELSVANERELLFRDARGDVRVPRPRHLHGEHQLENAGVALAVLSLLAPLAEHSKWLSAAEGAMLNAEWPARMQQLTRGPLADAARRGQANVWLDGGHNPAAGVALAATLTSMDPKVPTAFVVGMLRSKDVSGFLAPLRAVGASLYAVPIPSEGALALSAAEMAAAAKSVGFDAFEASSPLAAVEAAAAAGARRGRIVVCGSLYLAGSVLREMGGAEVSLQGGGEARASRKEAGGAPDGVAAAGAAVAPPGADDAASKEAMAHSRL